MPICLRLAIAAALLAVLAAPPVAFAQGRSRTPTNGPGVDFSALVGTPTNQAAVLSLLSAKDVQARVEFGFSPEALGESVPPVSLAAGVPASVPLLGLKPNTEYHYRVLLRAAGDSTWMPQAPASFRTARPRGHAFTFTVQGDSHPERPGRMYDPDLYVRALTNVAADKPDFHFLMGDDFSIERIIERGPPQGEATRRAVDAVYAGQRSFLTIVGKNTPLMLVNGNHEQAAKYLLDGTANNFAVFAGKARTTFFPLPATDGFYTSNRAPVEHIGLLRDYYAWEWGDALFVVIDPYWHSPVAVDNQAGARGPAQNDAGAPDRADRRGGGRGQRDLWQITLGDEQYKWLHATLTNSTAKFKFVFSHHVSGTGRGGVEVAPYFEWGGQDRRGGGGGGRGMDRAGRNRPGAAVNAPPEQPEAAPARGLDRFFQMRPTWDRPIHHLMRDSGVTIFFQGHDHLYARQELDGVVYQTCPNPADPTFTAFNRDAYRSGDIFPNSGHLRVSITGGAEPTAKVEYVRAARPGDEAERGQNGTIVHQYTVQPRAARTPNPNKEPVR